MSKAIKAKISKSLSKRRNASDVPRPADREGEQTIPQVLTNSGGPSHAQLRALAAGQSSALTLTDRYRVERRLGQGGMATVYAGRLLSLNRPVAIKILNEGVGHETDNRYARFVAEVHMTASLRHPNIVDVLDFGSTPEGVLFMVMELLEGEDLEMLVRRSGPLPWPQTQAIFRDICAGLAAVHRAGLVHRDLKPANCFLTLDSAKLLDFGIATRADASTEVSADSSESWQPAEERMTKDGAVLGTPQYLSPEQAQGLAVDARSDIYTAGILLGQLLTGRLPFEGRRATLVITDQIHEPAPSLVELAGEGVRIDPAVAAIYARALHKRPDERFATIEAFAAAIAAATITNRSPLAWRHQWQTGSVSERNLGQPSKGPKSSRPRTRQT